MSRDMDGKRKILDFIKTKQLGVIAVVNEDSKPEAGVVAFSETENLELIFGTSIKFRKYQRLTAHPGVAFAIGWDDDKITVQYEGVSREASGDEIEKCKKLHVAKNPGSAKYLDNPDERWFIITPTWIRYTDTSQQPYAVFEVSF